MTLDEAVAYIESKFECVDGRRMHRCETGDEYVQIVSGGIKEEGQAAPLFQDEEQAIGAWLDAVMAYAADKQGKLYWRIRPEVNTFASMPGSRNLTVYSRLVISDKAPLPVEDIGLVQIRQEGSFHDYEEGVIGPNHPRYAEIKAQHDQDKRIESLAMKLARKLGLDPNDEICRQVPQYVDLAHPTVFYIPDREAIMPVYRLFMEQARMMLEIINDEKS
jgi:hypothetical protein